MKRSFFALAAVVLLLGSACKAEEATPPDATKKEKSNTFAVNVDAKIDAFTLATTAFFPKQLSVHPGDSIDFKEIFTGEPHTVTMGTLVDAAVAAVAKAPEDGPPVPEMAKLPDIFGPPPSFQPLNQSAGQPCYLDSGEPDAPEAGGGKACTGQEQPEFNGTQTFYNSGYLAEDSTHTVKFSKDIKPAEYNIMCLVHREGMLGKVKVAPASEEIPAPEDVEKSGKAQLDKMVAALTPIHEAGQKAPADKAVAGAGAPDVMDATIAEFGPRELSIEAGKTVSWNVFFFHTIAINAPQDAIGVLIKGSDGAVTLNQKAGAPSKAPNPPPVVFGPEAKSSTVQATYGGEGFFNSGIMAGFPPDALVTYKIKFTKAGTYNLQCLVHPDMQGKVTVS